MAWADYRKHSKKAKIHLGFDINRGIPSKLYFTDGLMVRIYAGLITYLLLAIYCHDVHKERVSIKRVRELRIQIQNELRESACSPEEYFFKEHDRLHAKT